MEEELHKLMRTIDEKSEVDRKSSQFQVCSFAGDYCFFMWLMLLEWHQIICLAILAIDEAINGSRSFASEVEEIRSAASSYPEVLQVIFRTCDTLCVSSPSMTLRICYYFSIILTAITVPTAISTVCIVRTSMRMVINAAYKS